MFNGISVVVPFVVQIDLCGVISDLDFTCIELSSEIAKKKKDIYCNSQ